jgi:hypothetical protein
MNYYALVPEAAGQFGPNTVFVDKIARPPLVEKFHYEFNGWLGDPLVETIGCYIVTKPLRDKITSVNPSGVRFEEVEVSKSEEFVRRDPGRTLPPFVWLQITGVGGQDDFGYTITHGRSIVVSSRILDIMSGVGIPHCAVVELENWKGGKTAIMEKIRQFKLTNPPPIK